MVLIAAIIWEIDVGSLELNYWGLEVDANPITHESETWNVFMKAKTESHNMPEDIANTFIREYVNRQMWAG